MSDNSSKKLATTLKSLAITSEQFAPALAAIDSLKNNPGMLQLSRDLARHQEIMRTTLGSLQVNALTAGSPFHAEMEKARKAIAAYETQFRMPAFEEIARLTEQYRSSPIAEMIRQHTEGAKAFSLAAEAMRMPWVDATRPLRSLGGFAELQAIGQAVKSMPGFGDDLSTALRADLGDWRDRIRWPDKIFTDLTARSAFYAERGFNTALTEFPTPAFRAGLEIAKLKREPPGLIDLYGDPVPRADDDDEENGLQRTNHAHDWLQRLETRIRRFIDAAMTAACGADWPKHRLPNGLYEAWQEKKKAAEKAGGGARPLISYADFTDYERIICRKDNWQAVFVHAFMRQESIRESFQRLYPIRICTMHARPITHDDELFLYVETRRIMKVIR